MSRRERKLDIDQAIEHFELPLKIWPGNKDAAKKLKLLNDVKIK
jgi:hypothetical protein